MSNPRVLITVSGGVAETAAAPEGIDVEILDFDNLEAEGLDSEQREARFLEEVKMAEEANEKKP